MPSSKKKTAALSSEPLGKGGEGAAIRGLRTGSLISVILPVFNACRTDPRYLTEALASVRDQTYRNFELIIVNDGSTDDSESLCQDFASQNPDLPVRYFLKENGGQSSARNFGARMAKGEYLTFIDQDDVWAANNLEVKVLHLDPDTDLIYSDADAMDQESRTTCEGIHRSLHYGPPHPKKSIEDILFTNSYVMPGLMLIRREIFSQVHGFDERLSGYEDDDLFLRIYEIGKIKYVPVRTLKWRIYSNSYSQSDRMEKSRLLYWNKLLDRYADHGRDRRRAGKISSRFFLASVGQANSRYFSGNRLYAENLHGAKQILPFLPPWMRWIFKIIFSFNEPALFKILLVSVKLGRVLPGMKRLSLPKHR